MLNTIIEAQRIGCSTHAKVVIRELAPIVNSDYNFRKILTSYDYPRSHPTISSTEKPRSVNKLTEYLEANLLFFHAVKGGINGVEAILKEGYKPISQTGIETGAITEMDKLLGTDQATYFAIGTPNMYISEHGFDGPLLVYDSSLIKQNQNGYLNMSRKYVGDNRIRFDAYLQDPSQFSHEESIQLERGINEFAHEFLGMMLSPNLKYIAQFMKEKSIFSILDLLPDARKWELILLHPKRAIRPKAIIFRSKAQMTEAQTTFSELLTDINLSIQETIKVTDPIQSHVAPGSGSPINVYKVYKSLGLNIGNLKKRSLSPRVQRILEAWRSEGRPLEEIMRETQRVEAISEDMRIYS